MSITQTLTKTTNKDFANSLGAALDLAALQEKKIGNGKTLAKKLGYSTKADLVFLSLHDLRVILEQDELNPMQQDEVEAELKCREDRIKGDYAAFQVETLVVDDIKKTRDEILKKQKFAKVLQQSKSSLQQELNHIGNKCEEIHEATPGVSYSEIDIRARNTARSNADAIINNMERSLKIRKRKRTLDISLKPNDVLYTALRANRISIIKKYKKVSVCSFYVYNRIHYWNPFNICFYILNVIDEDDYRSIQERRRVCFRQIIIKTIFYKHNISK